jgi:hypothetical protein
MGGMNVSEAIRAQQDYLELSEGISEKTFVSSALNPKPSLTHCTKHLEHQRCPLTNCYVVLAQSRMQTSGKVSLRLLVE